MLFRSLGPSGGREGIVQRDGPPGAEAGAGEAPAGHSGGGGLVRSADGGGTLAPPERALSATDGILRTVSAAAVSDPHGAGPFCVAKSPLQTSRLQGALCVKKPVQNPEKGGIVRTRVAKR